MINTNSRVDGEKIAKKKFGQNFLKDETVLHKIIESMPNDDDPVVEIGPGLGDLTRYLVEIKDVTAYEVDKDLCEHLRRRFDAVISDGRLKLRCTDVLSHWDQESLEDRPYHMVANLPYYIATNIILRALKDPNCKSLLVMVQKEVAEKFSAQPGQKAFSALAVLAQSAGEVHLCFDVPPESFVPAPKVMSSVLRIVKKRTLDDSEFETFLKTAFTQPRKTLAKNLSARFDKKDVVAALDSLDLGPSVRPHEVETSLYHHLYKILKGDIDGREENSGKPTQQQ
ncbi:16S rRNA (adenine(1518)-N(6)/adenine(1519)-N(6))-dimethyltransferase RsmA [Hydrogenimonas cancrithermarum]|uniref:Ribosomal RNA small subunit methyltransferase A n=1 Tax=Hydrogenimonas cancrithermarum TaxID=2993563 RepID=A0ABN6WVT7_9BACT|nr:16S rRNA (adenine(1518)-N(6)/adenine(1519)-N(6))-dimethyltransferase RsmA [Hydrogenimonas cancrithermarum]BDY13136.1 ribosomal RNA small subunit methyltransferase A [Hydrogenimonas cancrithermarum]